MGIFSGIMDIAKVAAPFVGGLFASDTQEDINSAQMGLSRENRDVQMAFQREMWDKSLAAQNTSYERAVNSMKNAGLNPMLAYQQGGLGAPSAPAGSAGHVPQLGNKVAAGFSAAAAASQIENVKADTEKKGAEKANVEADTRLKLEGQLPDFVQRVLTGKASAAELEERAKLLSQEIRAWEVQLRDLGTGRSLFEHQQIAKTEGMSYDVQRKLEEFRNKYPDIQKTLIEAKILGLQIPEKVAEAAFFSGPDAKSAMYFRHAPKGVVGAGFGSVGAAADDIRQFIRDQFRSK